MADIYKALINTLVEPLCDIDEAQLVMFVENHRNGTPAEQAVAKVIERSLNYVFMTVAISTDDEEILED